MTNTNLEIRIEMLKNNIKYQDLADYLHIRHHNLSRKLRYPLSQKEHDRVLKAIEELKKQQKGSVTKDR
ncbi:MAG: hypothetical protein J6B87_06420 [Clostridia bacterium]|nr:hypothetical protein [Clostridia bacterium]